MHPTVTESAEDRGASSAEYALLIGIIGAGIIATLILLQPFLVGLYDNATAGW